MYDLTHPDSESGLVSASDVAAILSVQPKTIHNWADAGLIPVALRMGHTIRFRLDDVMQALNEATREAQLSRMNRQSPPVASPSTASASCASERRRSASDSDLILPG